MARQVLENGVILPAEYSDDWYDDMTSNLTKLDDVIGSDSEKLSSADVGAAALSNNYNDLDNKPTIPTVNDATLTIQKNGVDVQTFTANASSNVTCNITVPTKTSDLTNDSNYVDTSNPAVASGITSAKVTDYDTHIADTVIHVTTADKDRWNNQTYVFRYSSTALVASSTNSNALLDNTDNLKVGDKVIDSNGVLFSITAIDTQNSTFTIGTALIDLAQDSDVVHKSGNETVGGVKTFTDYMNFKSNVAEYGVTGGNIQFYCMDKNNVGLSKINQGVYSNGTSYITLQLYGRDSNNQTVTNSIIYQYSNSLNNTYLLPTDNSVWLGSTGYRWGKIYGIQYYYGNDNVEFSTKFVTTDTAQTITAAKTFDGVNINFKSKNAEYPVTGDFKDILFLDKNSTRLAYFRQGVYGGGIPYQSFYIIGYNSNNQQVSKSITFSSTYLDLSRAYLRPDADNAISLGRSNNRWSDVQTYKVNALEPSSLSLPSGNVSDVIDISSYITNLTGTPNNYTVPANGWISIAITGTAISIVSSPWSDTRSRPSDGTVRMLYPVLKGMTASISVVCTTLAYAHFIPCQGNV